MDHGPANSGIEGARLRYEHALRLVDRQAIVLSDLRSRASIILSASGITASVFGARAFEAGEAAVTWAALVAVIIGLALCIRVLWPVRDQPERRRWKVTLSFDEARDLTRHGSEPEMLDAIVAALRPARDLNDSTIARRQTLLNYAAVLLLVQVILWSVALLAG